MIRIAFSGCDALLAIPFLPTGNREGMKIKGRRIICMYHETRNAIAARGMLGMFWCFRWSLYANSPPSFPTWPKPKIKSLLLTFLEVRSWWSSHSGLCFSSLYNKIK